MLEKQSECESSAMPKQLSQTERALELSDSNSRMLMESISRLEEKLKPILREQSPQTVDKDCERKEESFVAVAEAIKKNGEIFLFANSRIRDILGRLEI